MRIENNCQVELDGGFSSMTLYDLQIESGSSLRIEQSTPAIISIDKADIYGDCFFDQADQSQ